MKMIRFAFLVSFLVHCGNTNAAYFTLKADSSEKSSIEFIELKAVLSSRVIHFTWKVAKEVAGDYFTIEKSIDNGESWNSVSRIESLANHDEGHTYEISEINMVEGIRELFRISRVDMFGDSEVLDAVDINHPVLSNMKLIPDPKRIKKFVTVSCESMIESEGTIHVYNEDHDLIFVESMEMVNGYNRSQLSIKNYPPGNYLIVVRNEFSDKLTRRLVVY